MKKTTRKTLKEIKTYDKLEILSYQQTLQLKGGNSSAQVDSTQTIVIVDDLVI
ncbi:MAG: hypothetical protein AB8G22_16670 [Saprospiraceae bacterium]